MLVAAMALEQSRIEATPPADVSELGIFGGLALLAVLDAGADPGFRHLRAHPGFGARLAPHRALRHLILSTLLKAGVLAPIASRERLDDAIRDAPWAEDASLEDADWLVVWDERGRGTLPDQLHVYLNTFESTSRTCEVILQTWQTLGTAECLAFGEYALAAHNLNPALARPSAAALSTILSQHSIGQGCALMWSAAKHVASWFMRNGVKATGAAEREFINSICGNSDRARYGERSIAQFSRHSSVPISTFARTFMRASMLEDDFWTSPLSEEALIEARLPKRG
ncbi:hypothetical protein PY254_10985 [Rhodanobacter sp. AS-Z3]|uniref:hypothetical protein n=1 Tax=Rhodanobacter sp. AS-Z3 TaxID=3031330 RepID=UPI0024796A24|nr:hypothetical protein [Rhodanobacter sp. AS-Z3]WEN13769.1 hypothetical protein PY254_10985 [Rhodanobacter sp. AS-Z3]